MRTKMAAVLLLSVAVTAASGALADGFREGEDYTRLPNATAAGSERVEIIEFFSYGCPHCAHLEPHLQEWKANGKSANVELRRIPVAWNKGDPQFFSHVVCPSRLKLTKPVFSNNAQKFVGGTAAVLVTAP